MNRGQVGLEQGEEGAPGQGVGWKVEWWREGFDRVSAEVARARDSGN